MQHPVAVARHFAEEVLASWGVGGAVREDIVLVVSELVANARLHTRGPRRVSLTARGGSVRIEVTDGSPVRPVQRPTSPGRPGGYGLFVVEELSTRWGADVGRAGKAVWAEFSVPGARD
ncbi:ATP-binding protein [Kitasatospora sp. NPDC087861]|uniref:ATP-binding protein n=1 Tax=unclassified Kitasatospora TaxID=2633591 RepID=UPI002474B9A2|nr:ATP-binding protein [Kitasatospora sp. MAA19]